MISLPLALLYQVRLDFTRKLAIAAILCLSVAMIVIASIRLAFGFLQFELTDTVWLSFWQTMEAATGVTMVSITYDTIHSSVIVLRWLCSNDKPVGFVRSSVRYHVIPPALLPPRPVDRSRLYRLQI